MIFPKNIDFKKYSAEVYKLVLEKATVTRYLREINEKVQKDFKSGKTFIPTFIPD